MIVYHHDKAGFCADVETGDIDRILLDKVRGTLGIGVSPSEVRWNLTQHGSGWLAHPDSINEIGCIHTCQGLELDYVGVMIGEDLVVRGGELVPQPAKRSKHDRSIRGYKKRLKADPERARAEARVIILNTYRTLMTRGLKGCYVYAVDAGVREWLRGGTGPSSG
jgi:hypothetical protein